MNPDDKSKAALDFKVLACLVSCASYTSSGKSMARNMHGALFTNMVKLQLLYGKVMTFIKKFVMKLLVHPQTSTVSPLQFENG